MHKCRIAALILFVSPLMAQTRTSFGDVSVDVPAGWSATLGSSAIKLTPGNLKPGETCVVILKSTEALNADFSSWFDNQWQSVLKTGSKVVQSSQPKHQAGEGSDNEAIFASAALEDAQQRPFWVILFGIRVGQRVFPLLWTANSQQLLAQYNSAVQQLVGSLKVEATTGRGDAAPAGSNGGGNTPGKSVGKSASPPDSPPPPNRLSGVYAGYYMGYGPGSSGSFEIRLFVFYPDGTAMYLPDEGLDGYDLVSEIRAGLDGLMYGTYEFHSDGRLRFASQNGVSRDLLIDTSADEPGLKYARVCHCDGARFNGTYYWGNKGMTITFLPDGRFIDRGASHDAWQYDYPDHPEMTNPGAGTYRIVNYTLYLDYSDGREMKHSFVVTAHPPKTPSAMWIRGYTFQPLEGPGGSESGGRDMSPAEPDARPAATSASRRASKSQGEQAAPAGQEPQNGSTILADGDPPLTKQIAGNFINFFAWVFEIKLTAQQKQMMERDLIASWPKDPSDEIKSKLQIADLYAQVMLSTDEQQKETRQKLQPQMLQILRSQQDDPVAKMLLKAYELQHPAE